MHSGLPSQLTQQGPSSCPWSCILASRLNSPSRGPARALGLYHGLPSLLTQQGPSSCPQPVSWPPVFTHPAGPQLVPLACILASRLNSPSRAPARALGLYLGLPSQLTQQGPSSCPRLVSWPPVSTHPKGPQLVHGRRNLISNTVSGINAGLRGLP